MTTPTKKQSPGRKEKPVAGAFLRMETPTENRAPAELGGQTLDEQEQIVHAHAARIGVTIRYQLVWVATAEEDTPDARITQLLDILAKRPVRHLLVPASLYQGYTDDDIMKHAVMLTMHGTELILVED